VHDRVHFADFEVDQRAGELRKGGVKVRLQEQPFCVLAALLESSGEVVTREELRTRLWPADTFVDFDHRLAAAVNKIRDALEDSAQSPRFIETVGRRGYRFLVPVELGERLVGPNGQSQDVADLPVLVSAGRKIKCRGIAIAGGALALLLAISFFVLHRWVRPGGALSAVPRISSIAVLPLENLSNDPEQQYFVEGMTDEITTDLAKLPGIRVISRTSAMLYKDTHKPMPCAATLDLPTCFAESAFRSDWTHARVLNAIQVPAGRSHSTLRRNPVGLCLSSRMQCRCGSVQDSIENKQLARGLSEYRQRNARALTFTTNPGDKFGSDDRRDS
jgi:DNA-binding winged helix-turn-helix (wHTH) protein